MKPHLFQDSHLLSTAFSHILLPAVIFIFDTLKNVQVSTLSEQLRQFAVSSFQEIQLYDEKQW
ncbi:MAG: hypothetical protein C1941_00600 [Prosthecochloris sp.]|nr:hypothetical protein [Prosthecochloris sp.]